jgi:hypothetical protein
MDCTLQLHDLSFVPDSFPRSRLLRNPSKDLAADEIPFQDFASYEILPKISSLTIFISSTSLVVPKFGCLYQNFACIYCVVKLNTHLNLEQRLKTLTASPFLHVCMAGTGETVLIAISMNATSLCTIYTHFIFPKIYRSGTTDNSSPWSRLQ